jgi:hypothetical protein
MQFRRNTILRLSGKKPDNPLERKSESREAAAIFRRFFYALEKLDLKARLKLPSHFKQRNEP